MDDASASRLLLGLEEDLLRLRTGNVSSLLASPSWLSITGNADVVPVNDPLRFCLSPLRVAPASAAIPTGCVLFPKFVVPLAFGMPRFMLILRPPTVMGPGWGVWSRLTRRRPGKKIQIRLCLMQVFTNTIMY
jgi:hypothetical protein